MLKYSPVLHDRPWVKFHIKESDKGPVIWEIKECEIFIRKTEHGDPWDKPLRLIVARNVMNGKEEEIKFFVSNASGDMPLDDLLLPAFSRWRMERSFEDTKQKLGLGNFEGRNYQGMIRHLLLCSLTYYFCKRNGLPCQKKRRIDILPSRAGHGVGTDAARYTFTNLKN
ncbi:MAG: hypothetical protein FWC50_14910 [Planctomycetaceae bacterium]|nr:hypothetical protein [Planctomycetaceae bacterium]